jgi:RNA polymerase sigma factor (sigma-70 family)
MRRVDDHTLLECWSGGDREAGSLLLERHFPSLHRFFGNKVSSLHDAEDLVQQTLVACVAARDTYRRDASFRTFLFAIARNTLLKHLRDRGPLDAIDADDVSLADCGLGLSSVVQAKREQRLLLRALRHIPIDSQVVLEMYYWEPMQVKEIAQVLGETVPAVRGRMRKAKAQLLEALEVLARDRDEHRSTVDGIDDWVRSLRAYWSG